MRVEAIKPKIGAIVEVEASRLGDADVGIRCRQLLDERGVLVFPRIGVTDAQQLAFTDNMGGREDYTKMSDGGSAGTEDVYTVTLNSSINSQKEYVTGTFFWHIDGIHIRDSRVLPKATCLSARTLAPRGGDTHFANTYAAYETMPESLRAEVQDLRARYDIVTYLKTVVEEPTEAELARWSEHPVNEWPIVWTHESGKKSLLIGADANQIEGMDLAASLALMARLQEWVAQPEFVYEHKWQEGDMVIWDNHGTLHRATPYAEDSGREMHRTTIAGKEAIL